MTGRGSGASPTGAGGSGTSFTERYAPPKPPRWRRILSLDTAQSVLTFVIALALLIAVAYLTWVSIERSGRLAEPETSSAEAAADPPDGTKTVELTSADGTVLSAWSTPAEARRSKSAVVLVHDAGGQRSDLVRLASALRGQHDVISLDLRGHGQSAEAPTTLGPAEADDVRAAIDAAVEAGDDRVVLVGVGLGGAAALAAASGDSRVDGVVVVAPWPRVADAVGAQLQDDEVPLAWPADWATLVAMLFRTGRDVTSTDVADTVGETSAPIVVVAGADDPLLSDDRLQTLESVATDLSVWQVPGDRAAAAAYARSKDGVGRIAEFVDDALGTND